MPETNDPDDVPEYRLDEDADETPLPLPPRGEPATEDERDEPDSEDRPLRGLGFVPDHPEDVRRVATSRGMLGAAGRLPSSASLLADHAGTPRDQSTTNPCVAFAIAKALRARLGLLYAVAGIPDVPPEFSPLAGYAAGRMLDRRYRDEPLVDRGSRPFQVVAAFAEFGVPVEAAWPFDAARINDEPPLDVFEKASAFKVAAHVRVDSEGESRKVEVMHLLAEGLPVVFAVDVDRAFQEHEGTDPLLPATGRILGGHMMLLLGYETTRSGIVFRGLNSYGEEWGDHGFFNAHESFVEQARADSFYAYSIAHHVERG